MMGIRVGVANLKFPYSPEEEQELNRLRFKYQDEPATSVIAAEYRAALENQLSVSAVATQEELLKRGDVDMVADALVNAAKEGLLQLQTELSERIANSLRRGAQDLDPGLARFGKYILQVEREGETGPFPLRAFVESLG